MKKSIFIALGVLLIFTLAVGCADDATEGETPGAAGGDQPMPEETPGTTGGEQPMPEETPEATGGDQTMPDTLTGSIVMEDGGVITFELYHDIAPQSVRNFVYLARSGFYDGLTFHRIISGFMIQGGCPLGTGRGNPGYFIQGEFAANGIENNLSHTRGVISMARAQQPLDSAGSQFFICHGDPTFLDGEYAAFGMVTSGMDVVDRLAETPVLDGNGTVAPEDMPVIATITIDFQGEVPEPDRLD